MAEVIEPGRSRIEDILLKASNGEALSRIEEILLSLYQYLVHLDPDTGLIPMNLIPPQVFERMVTVANDTERFALTTDDVQNGDWVYVNSTQIMYFVSDEDRLDTEAGYTPVAAGIAAKAVADKDGNQIDTTYQTIIDSDHKLSADNVDDSSSTNKFATRAQLDQIETNKNDILMANAEIGAFYNSVMTITSAERVDNTNNNIKFNYDISYTGSLPYTIYVHAYRAGVLQGHMEYDDTDVTSVVRAADSTSVNIKDLGTGVYVRLSIKIGERFIYGQQVYYKFSDLPPV